ncbi:MAG TPA: penicillin-binding protein 2 [Terriglobales bacterium]|nr:penicillin-binding protein 2 [Terriglobales bacterium]
MFSGREEKIPQLRLTMVQYGILAIFLVLLFGLWRLQVTGSERYESLAERNRVRTIPILAPRGKILDREGRVLVDNYPSFSVLLLRDQVKNIEPEHIDKIAAGLNMSPSEIRDRLRRIATAPAFQPLVLKDDITPSELQFIEAHKFELPELETILVSRRLYPKNGFLAHTIGYVGEVSEDMLNQPQYELYEPGMIVGKSGLEQQYNDLLMGKDGSRRAVVNSRGKEVDRLSETPAEPGKPLKLTIDLDLQIAAEVAMGDKNGAIVAMDPRTGEILAMVSRPTFDPNAFSVRISRQEWARLATDDEHPLMNKAIQAQLAPGSVFKIIMSVAGLQEGIAQTLHVNCPGGATFYGRYFKCWVAAEHRAHGAVDISKGIYQSCDVFFYTLAEKLGIGRIAQYATALGLGKRTGIDLPGEMAGVMPSEEWKIRNFKQKWYAGETISVGIGQGAVAVTPIQLTRAISGIAMGGQLRRPHLVFDNEVPQQTLQRVSAAFPEEVKFDLQQSNWETITDAMSNVPSPLGTANSAHLNGIDFAGKTGSAQTMSNALAQKLGHSHSMKDNAWFVGFTPRRSPEVVVGVLFEGGEHGQFAARIAAQVVKAFVEKQRARAAQQKTAELRPAKPEAEFTGVWSAESGDAGKEGKNSGLRAGRVRIPLAVTVAPAKAAPGINP